MGDRVQAQVAPPVDQPEAEALLAELRRKHEHGPGGGGAGAMVGAIAWASATLATDFQIGWMAVAVRFLGGSAVRLLGRAVDNTSG